MPGEARKPNALTVNALRRHPVCRLAVLPRRIHLPLFSVCRESMACGHHMDDALVDLRTPLRTDVPLTVFLIDPASYDDGALLIKSPYGRRRIKFARGNAALYPASTLHSVETANRGATVPGASWARSLVRDRQRHQLLFELDAVRHKLVKASPDSEEADPACRFHYQILGLWEDPDGWRDTSWRRSQNEMWFDGPCTGSSDQSSAGDAGSFCVMLSPDPRIGSAQFGLF